MTNTKTLPRIVFFDGAWHVIGGVSWELHVAACVHADKLNNGR